MNGLDETIASPQSAFRDVAADIASAETYPQPVEANPVSTHCLRRSGKRPLAFRGRELAHGMSFRVGTPLWYEINIFSVENAGFIGDVRMFTKSENEQDRFTVFVGSSLDEIAHELEHYDPAQDVMIDGDVADASVASADLAFRALSVRARVDSAREQYQSLLTEVFGTFDPQQIATMDLG